MCGVCIQKTALNWSSSYLKDRAFVRIDQLWCMSRLHLGPYAVFLYILTLGSTIFYVDDAQLYVILKPGRSGSLQILFEWLLDLKCRMSIKYSSVSSIITNAMMLNSPIIPVFPVRLLFLAELINLIY